MKKHLAIIFLTVFFAAGCAPLPDPSAASAPYTTPLTVGSKKIFVQVVSTQADMEQGLSGRPPLSDTQGMLFDFSNWTNKRPGFWMKDMKFNLDLIWIARGIIIAITKNAPAPASGEQLFDLPTYTPPADIDAVLEVNAGWADAHTIKAGDDVRLQ